MKARRGVAIPRLLRRTSTGGPEPQGCPLGPTAKARRLRAPPLAPAYELAFAEPRGLLGTGRGIRRTTAPESRPDGASGGQVVGHPAKCPRRAFCGLWGSVWLLGRPG